MLFFVVFLRESARTAAKSRTNLSTKCGKATKWLGRLAPNLAHMCKFIWEWIYAKQIAPRDTRGHLAGFRGSTIQKSWEAVLLPPTLVQCADSSGNGHRIDTSRPSIPQGAFLGGGGGLGCHKFKSLGKLSNGWTDWHQIWHTCANSYGNGYTPNKLLLETQEGTWRVLGGQQFKSWEAVRLAPTLFQPADSSGNGHRLNPSRPSIPRGALGGGWCYGVTNSKV